jgi:hypothetical protein
METTMHCILKQATKLFRVFWGVNRVSLLSTLTYTMFLHVQTHSIPSLEDLREALHGAQLLWTSATVYKLECVSLFVQIERAEVLLSCCVGVQTRSTCPLLSAQRKPLEGAATT